MAKEVEKTPEELLAEEINKLQGEIEEAGIDQRLELARKVVEAEKLIGEANWSAWAAEKLDLSTAYLNQMLQIGKAEDPSAELKKVREGTRERVKKHREKLRNNAQGNAITTKEKGKYFKFRLPSELDDRSEEDLKQLVRYCLDDEDHWCARIRWADIEKQTEAGND
jgi:DUF3102 family protein